MIDFKTESYWDENDQVYRWKSNDNIPFSDMLEANGVPSGIIANCERVRDEELAAFTEQYIKRQQNLTDEERAERDFELRAAFGPGVEVVDILSGSRYRT